MWFDDLPVLGKMSPETAARKLKEMGDTGSAETLQGTTYRNGRLESYSKAPGTKRFWKFLDKAYKHTAHAFGYIAPAPDGQTKLLPVQYAGNIAADEHLKDQRIKITLDRLRVKDYPGFGMHHILFDFYARNQVPGDVEHLHFNAAYRAREGEQVAVVGYPIFVGLHVGTEGVAFRCFTVNVKNDSDEVFLNFLDSDVFKAGLKLASTIQPATRPLSEMALGMTKAIASRTKNVPVQDFYMGLDFGNVPTGARLAEGSYIAVQIPGSPPWDWSDYVYNPVSGQIVDTSDNSLLPYNYVVFGVSRYDGD